MSDTDRDHLVANIVAHATHGPGLDAEVAARVGGYWRAIDPGIGAPVTERLGAGDGAGWRPPDTDRAPKGFTRTSGG